MFFISGEEAEESNDFADENPLLPGEEPEEDLMNAPEETEDEESG